MYRPFLWKTFDLGKTAGMPAADRAAGKTFYNCRNRREGTLLLEKILAPGQKISAICGEAGRDMVYFILDYHKQNKTLRRGTARPERKEHKRWKNVTSRAVRAAMQSSRSRKARA